MPVLKIALKLGLQITEEAIKRKVEHMMSTNLLCDIRILQGSNHRNSEGVFLKIEVYIFKNIFETPKVKKNGLFHVIVHTLVH